MTPLTPIPIEIPLKGTRNYLRGADFVGQAQSALQSALGSGYLSRLTFRRFTQKESVLLLGVPESDAAFADGLFTLADGSEANFHLAETENETDERVAFDEDRIVGDATFALADQRAHVVFQSNHTMIDHIVALTKRLHYALAPDVQGKWVLVRLDFKQALPERAQRVSILVDRLVQNRFSTSQVLLDDISIGTIRFMVGQP